MKPIKVLSLCDGMGCGLLAFKSLGIEVEYHAVEIDTHARKLCDHNQEVIRWANGVTLIKKEDIQIYGPFDEWTNHPAVSIEALKDCYEYLEFEVFYLGGLI